MGWKFLVKFLQKFNRSPVNIDSKDLAINYTDLKFTIFCKLQRPEYTFQGDWRMLIPKIITILLEHLWFSRKLAE